MPHVYSHTQIGYVMIIGLALGALLTFAAPRIPPVRVISMATCALLLVCLARAQ